jgi:hypothetical protein
MLNFLFMKTNEFFVYHAIRRSECMISMIVRGANYKWKRKIIRARAGVIHTHNPRKRPHGVNSAVISAPSALQLPTAALAGIPTSRVRPFIAAANRLPESRTGDQPGFSLEKRA